MTNADIREAHKLLDYVSQGRAVLDDEIKLLRSFLPELPKQKTLQQIIAHVDDAWAGAIENEWPDDMYCDLENWLYELHVQLQGLADAEPAKSAHPEFLETKADYTDVPEGTILTMDGLDTAWVKKFDGWASTGVSRERTSKELGYTRRRVLRWGWGK